MNEQIEKIVDGVTYERNYLLPKCADCVAVGCVPTASGGSLCANLNDEYCGFIYSFKIKDITKHHTPPQKASEASQGVKTDTGKPRFTLIPPFALEQMAICLTEGLITHPDKDNWKLVEDGKARFLDSLYRHWNQYQMGEVFDRDNPKVRNLAAIMVNAAFALEFEVNPELKGKE